jgi:hypothetical protein
MTKKWKPLVIENVKVESFDIKVYEQELYEMASIIYSDLCQLQKDSISDSFNDENNFLQRTGTDA